MGPGGMGMGGMGGQPPRAGGMGAGMSGMGMMGGATGSSGFAGGTAVVEDPELQRFAAREADLERRTQTLARTYVGADKEARADVTKQLKETIEEHFRVRQERRRIEVRRLLDQVERLERQLDKRESNKGQIVNRRFAELTGEDELGFE
jgi:hypothetical protein